METQFFIKAVASFTIQTLIVIFLLEVCRSLGKFALWNKLKEHPTIYVSFGFSLLLILELYAARFLPAPHNYLYWVAVLALFTMISTQYKRVKFNLLTKRNTIEKRTSGKIIKQPKIVNEFQYLAYALPGLISSSIYYIWVVISSPITKPYLNSFTLSNNDLGVYLIDSTNIAKSGYKNSGDILFLDPTHWIETDHPAAKSFFAITPSIFGLNNWQFGNVGMIFLISLLSIGLMTFAVDGLKIPLKFSFLITSIAVSNPYVFYTIGNFFLAQTICLSLLVLGINVVTLHLGIRECVVILSSTFAALLVTSSETSIILLLFLVLLQILKGIFPEKNAEKKKSSSLKSKKIFNQVHTTLDSYLLSLLIVAPWIVPAIKQIFTSAKDGVGGWPLFVWNPLSWVGVDDIGTRNFDASLIIGLIAIFAIYCAGRGKINSKPNVALIIFGILCLTLAAGTIRWGSSAYQTWKLFTTLQPILLVIIFAFALPNKINKSLIQIGIIFLGISLSIMQTFSGIQQSRNIIAAGNISHHIISTEFRLLLDSEIAKRQNSIDVMVQPYFETMGSVSIAKVPINLVSPTYYSGGEYWPFRSKCVVTTKDFLDRLPANSQIRLKFGDYLLVDNPKCV